MIQLSEITNIESEKMDEINSVIFEMTPKKYYELSIMERLAFHISVAQKAYLDNSFNDVEYLKEIGNERKTYKYRYIENGKEILFKNAKELQDYTGKVVQKINADIKKGVISAELYRINEIHITDKNGNTLDIIKRRVY